MFDFILGNTVFTKTIMTCCFIGILSWSVLTISYRSMIRATSRIGQTKKKWLVSLKKKYEDYHEMDIKVNNVETFVDKYFRKKKSLWISLCFLENLISPGNSGMRDHRGGRSAGCLTGRR